MTFRPGWWVAVAKPEKRTSQLAFPPLQNNNNNIFEPTYRTFYSVLGPPASPES